MSSSDFWHLTYEIDENKEHGRFTLYVKMLNFDNYLENKLAIFPVYLKTEYTWYHLSCPYVLKISPIAEHESVRLKINKIISFPFPHFSFGYQFRHFMEQATDVLLAWVEEEYTLYLKECVKGQENLN